ncbi:microsomal dipeptidase-like Zn-dependent dipeptidase [Salinibacter ruber]|uniref:dipeptidase n=1 Tax=Salinibacter ruber TaxID=146919 RepID=UPI002168AD71|nr:membrane dipeptidase [Salinibacter ruber]MCS3939322.1 microsomal dipeptidase-like Zn-dependent dipeptidase [Salinibacter ruber]
MVRLLLYVLIGFAALVVAGYFTVAAPIADARYNTVQAEPPYDPSGRAQALHDTLMVADLHNDLLLWGRDPLTRHDRGHTDVPRLRAGGVGLQVFAAVTQVPRGRSYAGTDADALDQIPFLAAAQRWPVRTWTSRLERARYQAKKLRRAAARDGALFLLRTRADLDALLARRRTKGAAMGTLLAVEGLHALEGEAAHVDTLVDDGYRMMSLTHMHDNALGGASTGLDKSGLTDYGAAVVDRLVARNVTIDLAHASEALIDDVLARTRGPVVVSHTGVRATCDSPRNLSDRHIKAVAARGGVIGVGLWETAVCGPGPAAVAASMRHVADLVGVEHVALGTDFDGTVSVPFDATGFPLLTEALLAEGFSPRDIEQIMGANVVRVLRQSLPPAE